VKKQLRKATDVSKKSLANVGAQDLDVFISQYKEAHFPLHALFAQQVSQLLTSLLQARRIRVHSISHRAKAPDSLRRKMATKEYVDPLKEVTDLSGVRVITYFPTDVDKVLHVIARDFDIDQANSIDKRQGHDPNVFGYASVHLIVGLNSARTQLAEYGRFTGLRCEVQVRTVLQHAWAEIEHDLVYKSSADMPFELRRRFSSLAGMLEIADHEFESLRKKETSLRTKIRSTIESLNFEVPINLDSLAAYLQVHHDQEEMHVYYLRRFLEFATANGISTIMRLDELLSGEDVAESRRVLNESVKCVGLGKCLLEFFFALAKRLGLPPSAVAEASTCERLDFKRRTAETTPASNTVRPKEQRKSPRPPSARPVRTKKRPTKTKKRPPARSSGPKKPAGARAAKAKNRSGARATGPKVPRPARAAKTKS